MCWGNGCQSPAGSWRLTDVLRTRRRSSWRDVSGVGHARARPSGSRRRARDCHLPATPLGLRGLPIGCRCGGSDERRNCRAESEHDARRPGVMATAPGASQTVAADATTRPPRTGERSVKISKAQNARASPPPAARATDGWAQSPAAAPPLQDSTAWPCRRRRPHASRPARLSERGRGLTRVGRGTGCGTPRRA